MILRLIAASHSVEIEDPGNFRALSVRLEGPFATPDSEAALLDRIAVARDGEHAWISEDVLRAWPTLADEPWWNDGLTGMMGAVERFGWVDRANRSIRAHIERA